MKIREIILDFTSLLDVIMIILFFFVLYSTIDTEKAANQAKEAEASYNALIEEQHELNDEASKELERIKAADKNSAANQKALNAFDKGDFFTFTLDVVDKSDNWTLDIKLGNKQLGMIDSHETSDVKASVREVLQKSALSDDDAYICILSFDGEQFGTARAVRVINEAIESIQREYPNLYFSNLNSKK
ncbi:MAG: hypothetical protein IKW96_10860 [Ruminococcus sp.]|uniref:hypothetical protein n=1 Tax=Ruminococcus sp. TaxID=41978 RepID=UPI0025D482FE|nr:hypothetical protein [Ruminococcus sp.]MBR5683750.1 hypothetical protein [Ruminococcus sp.]